jgi:hypothetical protein
MRREELYLRDIVEAVNHIAGFARAPYSTAQAPPTSRMD